MADQVDLRGGAHAAGDRDAARAHQLHSLMDSFALYLHIPFCKKKCAYCDFTSFAGREDLWNAYLAALESELLAARATYGRRPISTIFVGGGTPSLVPADWIMHLLAMARALFQVDPDAEITLEANPGTVTRAKLRDYRDAGVNRLSLGMQTAEAELLQMLGRIHTQREVEETVALARDAGFQNLNLDLMYALPTQTMAQWVDTLKQALNLKPTHLSMYSLILEPGTPLAARVDAGELPAPDEELTLKMQHAAARIVGGRGFQRYEISNYALAGCACRHNLAYWTRANYLGVGLSAHSLMDSARFSNTDCLPDYLAGRRECAREVIDEAGAREEAILLGTRLARGIDEALVKDRAQEIAQMKALGLIGQAAGRISLTEKGMDVQNAVVLKLI
ncbi:MAG: radical SAM family heme chaperone HemW [Clostridia bacterium]